MELVKKINQLKKEKDFAIVSHNYCRGEVIDIADYCGDSLALAKLAYNIKNENVIFAGVKFMAETMKMLSPEKKIFTAAGRALCPMAATLSPENIKELKKQYPGIPVVLYVNTTTECKERADYVCTSGNAIEIITKLDSDTILFGPDKHLGSHIAEKTGKNIILISGEDGFCYVHNNLTIQDYENNMTNDCKFIGHPECPQELRKRADYIGSTGDMMKIPEFDDSKNFLIGTESGMLHRLKKKFPEKNFIPISENCICRNMKKNTLEGILHELENQENEIILSDEIMENAKKPIINMLNLMKK